ncbi:MAG: hypothetical protein RLZZ579_291 [Actinomycetota bacterium]
MSSLIDVYLRTEIILSATDGVTWGTVETNTKGSITGPGGLLGLLGIGADSALVVTAWNPLGKLLSIEDNERLQRELIADLNELGLVYFSVMGQEPGGGWKEDSLLVPVEDFQKTVEIVLELARKFQQNAIFEITESTKRVIGVCMNELDGIVSYSLLPLGTQGIDLEQ